MFKKPEIKKALFTICSHKANLKSILVDKTDPEQSDKAFVKEYANKLYSEELFEYLNDNRVDKFDLVEFGNLSKMGELWDTIAELRQEGLYDDYLGTALTSAVMGPMTEKGKRVCCVSSESICTNGDNQVCLKTYIMENGNVLVLREVSCNGLTIRFPDTSSAPSLYLVQDICGDPTASKTEEPVSTDTENE